MVQLKLVLFSDILKCMAVCIIYIIMKVLNGCLKMQKRVTLKDVCGWPYEYIIARKLRWPRRPVGRKLTCTMRFLCSQC